MSENKKPMSPKLLKLRESAKRMHKLRLRKELLEKLLANWPTADEIRKDPERLAKLSHLVAKIEQAMIKDREADADA